MIRAACEDEKMNQTLVKILSLPGPDRREMIRNLVVELTNKKSPDSLVEAIACLVSDDVATKTYEVLNQRA
jgi:hypothetical protein